MNEMKRRVAAILEFISRTQLEMASSAAGDNTPPVGNGMESATATVLRGLMEDLPGISMNGGGGEKDNNGGKEKPFADLTSLEMMDVLTRKLVLWQKEFGKWGEK